MSETIRTKYEEVSSELCGIEERRDTLCSEIKRLQEECRHPDLPKRAVGEEYMDTCPDCGFTQYCYAL